VKLADLDDQISHGAWSDDYPPFGWARRHIVVAGESLAA
jgi:hypothetical protein